MARTIQSVSTSTGVAASTTVSVTLPANIRVGSKIIGYWFANTGGVDDLLQIKDALGNANATIVDTVNPGGDIQKTFFYDVTVAGAAVVTATTTGSYGFRGLVVHEVEGLVAGAPDQHALVQRTAIGTGIDAITSGPVTTTKQYEYVFGAVHVNNNIVMTVTPGSGYRGVTSIDGTALISPLESEEKFIIGPQAGVEATFTQNSANDCAPGIMTFEAVPPPVSRIKNLTDQILGEAGGGLRAMLDPKAWYREVA